MSDHPRTRDEILQRNERSEKLRKMVSSYRDLPNNLMPSKSRRIPLNDSKSLATLNHQFAHMMINDEE